MSQDSYRVLPGDSFRTTCYYKDGSKFGLSSQDEMCIAYMMYYPAKQSSLGKPWVCPHDPWKTFGTDCTTELDYTVLNGVDDLRRSFGDSSGECEVESSTDSSTTGKSPAPVQN